MELVAALDSAAVSGHAGVESISPHSFDISATDSMSLPQPDLHFVSYVLADSARVHKFGSGCIDGRD